MAGRRMLIYVELWETVTISGKNHTDQSKDRPGNYLSVRRTTLHKHIIYSQSLLKNEYKKTISRNSRYLTHTVDVKYRRKNTDHKRSGSGSLSFLKPRFCIDSVILSSSSFLNWSSGTSSCLYHTPLIFTILTISNLLTYTTSLNMYDSLVVLVAHLRLSFLILCYP